MKNLSGCNNVRDIVEGLAIPEILRFTQDDIHTNIKENLVRLGKLGRLRKLGKLGKLVIFSLTKLLKFLKFPKFTNFPMFLNEF